MNKYVKPLISNTSEATVACLVTMVQGNVLAIGLEHLNIALQIGVTAGAAATIVAVLAKPHMRSLIALILGAITTVVDFLVHPGTAGSVFTEAIVTGAGAALLSYVVSGVIAWVRRSPRPAAETRGI